MVFFFDCGWGGHAPRRGAAIDTATQEQAWNSLQMAEPVTQPRFRVWTYRAPCHRAGLLATCAAGSSCGAVAAGREDAGATLGGGAVLTGPWMVSASVVLPLSHPWAQGRLPDSYRGLGQLHGDVLASLGVAAGPCPRRTVPAANARRGAVVELDLLWQPGAVGADRHGRSQTGGPGAATPAHRRAAGGAHPGHPARLEPCCAAPWASRRTQPAMQRRTVDCATLARPAWDTALLADGCTRHWRASLTP